MLVEFSSTVELHQFSDTSLFPNMEQPGFINDLIAQ